MLELCPGSRESAWAVQRVDNSGCSIWHALVRSSVSDAMQAFVVFSGEHPPHLPRIMLPPARRGRISASSGMLMTPASAAAEDRSTLTLGYG